ncbi:hypothetical protein KC345_g2676 [Hortaea werneckii]|nr:hypothetical protein KC345_g2676 [Hortaea werneckii]
MPRPKKEGTGEPKKRSRTGCWPCKARKVKCGEEKPVCTNCAKSGETCDYSIKLNWGGRSGGDKDGSPAESAGLFTFVSPPTSAAAPATSAGSPAKNKPAGREHVFSAQHIQAAPDRPRDQGRRPANRTGARIDPRLSQWAQRSDRQGVQHSPFGVLQQQTSSDSAPRLPPSDTGAAPTNARMNRDEFRWSPQHSAKRVKLSSAHDTPHSQPSPAFAVPPYPQSHHDQSPATTNYTPHSINSIVNTPATPSSSINSGSPYPPQSASLQVQDPPDLRRLSVKSLLSEPAEEPERSRLPVSHDSHRHRTYGFDHGLPDYDIPHNNDNAAILPKSPDMRRTSGAPSGTGSFSNHSAPLAFESGGYYASPVPIRIPRFLEPLPDELLNNNINLLYFHHFINHTGRIMVPHDCPENPFRGVLPQMAIRNTQLLHLLLTFSASHRARLLDHPEPANRIAEWMSDVLPALRQALTTPRSPGSQPSDPTDPSSLAPLATAIMLASLEIISPHTFAVQIPWQHHLNIARQMIIQTGGLHHLAQKADGAKDKAIFFLSRWFAYLDVLGSLSSGSRGGVPGGDHAPLDGAYLEDGGGAWLVNRSDEEIYQIDCFFGFSGRCIALLAQVAELTSKCDRERIDRITGNVVGGWRPPEDVQTKAWELKMRLEASATTVFRGCMHTGSGEADSELHGEGKEDNDAEEIYATNEAYHWAALINLLRRVLGFPSDHPEVQHNVRRVSRSLGLIRPGSTAESCLLFPIFSAGCETQGEKEREAFMERLRSVEGWGMSHVGRAKELMERVWKTGQPWEGMVGGEFFG